MNRSSKTAFAVASVALVLILAWRSPRESDPASEQREAAVSDRHNSVAIAPRPLAALPKPVQVENGAPVAPDTAVAKRAVYNPGSHRKPADDVEQMKNAFLLPPDPAEERVALTLASAESEAAMVHELFGLLTSPDVRGRTQASVADRLTYTVTSDADYDRLASYVVGEQVGHEAMAVLFADLLQREEDIKLPILAEIATAESHQFRDDARAVLQFFANPEDEEWREILQSWAADPQGAR